ncbi:uncharacterized protein [Dermacentor andersoni]|uniref:uncharacterized protein n=1 Tax=Dermacentor andersoni TaxID=34620 RepID=UPI003B3B6AA4
MASPTPGVSVWTLSPDDVRTEATTGTFMRADIEREGNENPTEVRTNDTTGGIPANRDEETVHREDTGIQAGTENFMTKSTRTPQPAPDALLPTRQDLALAKPGRRKPGKTDIEREGNENPTLVTVHPEDTGIQAGAENFMRADMEHEGNGKPTPVTQPTGKTRRPSPDGLLPPGHGSAVAKPGRRKPGRVEMGHEGNEIPTPVRGDIESEGHEKPTPVRKNNAAGGKPRDRDEEGHWTAHMEQATILPEEADMEGPAGNFVRAHAESEGNGRPTPATRPTGKTRLPAADGFVPRKNGAAGGKPNRYEEAMLPEEGSMEGADGSFVRAHVEIEGNGRPTPVTQSNGKTRPPAADAFVPRQNEAAGEKPANRYEEGHWAAEMGQGTILPVEASMEGADGNYMRAHVNSEENGRPTPVTQPTGKTRLPAADAFAPPRNGSIVANPGKSKPGNADIESEGNQMPTPVTQPTGRTRPPAPEVQAPVP